VEPTLDRALRVHELRPGMRTARDLVRGDGSLLLSAEHVLTERMIRQLVDIEKLADTAFTVYVKLEGEVR
jgi:hypothetical protein